MPVYEMSSSGSVKVPRVNHQSMNAGNQYGAMVPIASTTFDGSAFSTAFNNIPQTYQDLRIVAFVRGGRASTIDAIDIYFNGITTGGLWSATNLQGDGSTAGSIRQTSTNVGYGPATIVSASGTSGVYSSVTFDILNYSNSSTFKTVLVRVASDANGSGQTLLQVYTYRSTSPVSIVTLLDDWGSNFATGSTITLYGIRASNA